MVDGYKVIVGIFAGRKKIMRQTIQTLLKQGDCIDEIQLWENTALEPDLKYISECEKKIEKLSVKRYEQSPPSKFHFGGTVNHNMSRFKYFFKDCTESDTVYVKVDDDMIWMEDGLIESLVRFTLKNPKYISVFANVVNISGCDHVHQRLGVYEEDDIDLMTWNKAGACSVGWACGRTATAKHLRLFENMKNDNLDQYKFSRWVLNDKIRHGAGFMSWISGSFDVNKIGEDDEDAMVRFAKETGRNTCIFGEKLASHFSYHPQEAPGRGFEKNKIWKEYEKLIFWEKDEKDMELNKNIKIVINTNVNYGIPLKIAVQSLIDSGFSDWQNLIIVMSGSAVEKEPEIGYLEEIVGVSEGMCVLIETKRDNYDYSGYQMLYEYKDHPLVDSEYYFYSLDTVRFGRSFIEKLNSLPIDDNHDIYVSSSISAHTVHIRSEGPPSNISLFNKKTIETYKDNFKPIMDKEEGLQAELRSDEPARIKDSDEVVWNISHFGNVKKLGSEYEGRTCPRDWPQWTECQDVDVYETGTKRSVYYYPLFDLYKYIKYVDCIGSRIKQGQEGDIVKSFGRHGCGATEGTKSDESINIDILSKLAGDYNFEWGTTGAVNKLHIKPSGHLILQDGFVQECTFRSGRILYLNGPWEHLEIIPRKDELLVLGWSVESDKHPLRTAPNHVGIAKKAVF